MTSSQRKKNSCDIIEKIQNLESEASTISSIQSSIVTELSCCDCTDYKNLKKFDEQKSLYEASMCEIMKISPYTIDSSKCYPFWNKSNIELSSYVCGISSCAISDYDYNWSSFYPASTSKRDKCGEYKTSCYDMYDCTCITDGDTNVKTIEFGSLLVQCDSCYDSSLIGMVDSLKKLAESQLDCCVCNIASIDYNSALSYTAYKTISLSSYYDEDKEYYVNILTFCDVCNESCFEKAFSTKLMGGFKANKFNTSSGSLGTFYVEQYYMYCYGGSDTYPDYKVVFLTNEEFCSSELPFYKPSESKFLELAKTCYSNLYCKFTCMYNFYTCLDDNSKDDSYSPDTNYLSFANTFKSKACSACDVYTLTSQVCQYLQNRTYALLSNVCSDCSPAIEPKLNALVNERMDKDDGSLTSIYSKMTFLDRQIRKYDTDMNNSCYFLQSLLVLRSCADGDNSNIILVEDPSIYYCCANASTTINVGDTVYILDDKYVETQATVMSIGSCQIQSGATVTTDSSGNTSSVASYTTVKAITLNIGVCDCYTMDCNFRLVKEI